MSTVIEGYFQILLKQCDDELDIPLLCALLGEFFSSAYVRFKI
jgi:hypothetical protein